MPVTYTSRGLVTAILEGLPHAVTRHLTLLECGELALCEAFRNEKANQPEACCGADDAAQAILGRVASEPTELKKMGRLEGVRLSDDLFHPVIDLDEAQGTVYGAALATSEYKMRRLYDSNYKYPDHFQL